MTDRVLLLLGLVLLQTWPELTGHSRIPVERPPMMDEADADSLEAAIGGPPAVWVEELEGVPAEAAEREAFLAGFRGRFREREAPGERLDRRAGAWKPDAPVTCRLRLADEPRERGSWTVRVRLDWHVPRDESADSLARAWPGRGARVTITVTAPEETAPGALARAAPPPARRAEWLRFPSGHPVDAAYLRLAGRQVAAVAMEAVLRARGELGEDRRLRLEQTERVTPLTGR